MAEKYAAKLGELISRSGFAAVYADHGRGDRGQA